MLVEQSKRLEAREDVMHILGDSIVKSKDVDFIAQKYFEGTI